MTIVKTLDETVTAVSNSQDDCLPVLSNTVQTLATVVIFPTNIHQELFDSDIKGLT